MPSRPDFPYCAACAIAMPRAARRCLECLGELTPASPRPRRAPARPHDGFRRRDPTQPPSRP